MRRLMNGRLVTARTRQSQSPALGSSVKAHTPGGSESRRTIHHSSRRRSTPRRAWRIVHMRSRYTEVPRPPTKRPPGPGWRGPVHGCLAPGTSAARLDPDRLCGCCHGIAETRLGRRRQALARRELAVNHLEAPFPRLAVPVITDAHATRTTVTVGGGCQIVGDKTGVMPFGLHIEPPLVSVQADDGPCVVAPMG